MAQSQIIVSGKPFSEFLLTHDLDCDLIIADVDSVYSFVHNKGDNFTPEGKKKFAPILDAAYDYLENGNIVIHCDDEALGELFMAAYAGYVANSAYKTWFKE